MGRLGVSISLCSIQTRSSSFCSPHHKPDVSTCQCHTTILTSACVNVIAQFWRQHVSMSYHKPDVSMCQGHITILTSACVNVIPQSALRPSYSGTFLQTLPDLVTPLSGHSLSPRSCPPTRSAPSERFGY